MTALVLRQRWNAIMWLKRLALCRVSRECGACLCPPCLQGLEAPTLASISLHSSSQTCSPSQPPSRVLPSFFSSHWHLLSPTSLHPHPWGPYDPEMRPAALFQDPLSFPAWEQAGSQGHEHRVAWWQRSAQGAVVPLSRAAVGREWRRTCQWKTAFSKTPLEKHSNSQTHPQSVYSFQHHS